MLKSSVSHSINADHFLAGFESAKANVEKVNNPKISFLFTSCNNNIKQVVKGIKSIASTPIIGCTSSGGIVVPEGVINSKDGFVGLMTLSDENLNIGIACHEAGKDPRMIGRKVAIEAVQNAKSTRAPAYFYMVASPGEEEEYLMGIQDVIGRVPMFGGSAADEENTGDWKIICDEKIIDNGVAVAFFYTDSEIATSFNGCYNETKNIGIITSVEENRVLKEIDGISALRKYAHWINVSPLTLKGNDIIATSITKPLGIKNPQGNLILIKQPMYGDDMGTKTTMDDTIRMGNKVLEGTAIIQLESTIEEMVKANSKVIENVKKQIYTEPAAYILINCANRKKAMESRLEDIYNDIIKETKNVPFIMPFTYGQYGYEEHSENSCGGLMMSYTIFGKN